MVALPRLEMERELVFQPAQRDARDRIVTLSHHTQLFAEALAQLRLRDAPGNERRRVVDSKAENEIHDEKSGFRTVDSMDAARYAREFTHLLPLPVAGEHFP